MNNNPTFLERLQKHWLSVTAFGFFSFCAASFGALLTHRQDVVFLLENKGIIPIYYGIYTDGELLGHASISENQKKIFRLGGGYYGDVRPVSLAGYRCTWKALANGMETTIESRNCTISSDDILEKVQGARSVVLTLNGFYPSRIPFARLSEENLKPLANPGKEKTWQITLSILPPSGLPSSVGELRNSLSPTVTSNGRLPDLGSSSPVSHQSDVSKTTIPAPPSQQNKAGQTTISLRCKIDDENPTSADLCNQLTNYHSALQKIASRIGAVGLLVKIRSGHPDNGFEGGQSSVILGTFDVTWLGSPGSNETLKLSSGSNGTTWGLAEIFVQSLQKEFVNAR